MNIYLDGTPKTVIEKQPKSNAKQKGCTLQKRIPNKRLMDGMKVINVHASHMMDPKF